jgi:hypothetical protein
MGFIIMILDILVNSIDLFSRLGNDDSVSFFYYTFQAPFLFLISIYLIISLNKTKARAK